jgi:hypothetical protein
MRSRWAGTAVAAAVALLAAGHVGSPDTVFEGAAGPYRIRVIVRPPGIVPGQAEITVRILSGPDVRAVQVLPLRGGRPTAEEPPPDSARSVPGDPRVFSAQLWLMESGAYSIRVDIVGAAGAGRAVVPVNSVATRRLGFATPLALGLVGLGLFLLVGAITIVGAAVRESVLPPGAAPDAPRRRRSWWIRLATVPLLALAVLGGKRWWDGVDVAYRSSLFRPMRVTSTVTAADGARTLRIAITDSEWLGRQYTPLIPDHGKLMHLFLVEDHQDAFAHLHPRMLDSSAFQASLPPLLPGRYFLFADVVHESGFTQTLVDTLVLSAAGASWQPTDSDDAWWVRRPPAAVDPSRADLDDGSVMTWQRDTAPLVAGRDVALRFSVTTRDGRPAALEPYMGMASHAVVERDDGAVFVHLHPAGTIAMASQLVYALREPGDTVRGRLGARITAAEREMVMAPESAVVSIPYAFPSAGRYRVWVQVKRGGRILTGAFDTRVVAGAP